MELRRRVVAEHDAGETLHGLSGSHDACRNLLRIRTAEAEAGEFDDEVAAAGVPVRDQARIAFPERLVGRQALELSCVREGVSDGPLPTSAATSVIAGPAAFPSKGGAS